MASGNPCLNRALAATVSLGGLSGSILSAAGGESARSLLVTSARDGEGKSTAAVAMAVALARQSSAPVLVVDVNFRRPALAQWFGVAPEPGFREYLRSGSGAPAVHRTGEPGLSVLTAGGNVTVADMQTAFPSRLKELLNQFSCVVLDGDSTLTSSDAALFARHVDGIVLAAECEQTKWEVISQAHERLARLGGRVLGVTLNKRKLYIPGVFYEKS